MTQRGSVEIFRNTGTRYRPPPDPDRQIFRNGSRPRSDRRRIHGKPSGSMTLPDFQERRQNDPRQMIQTAIRTAAPDQEHRNAVRSTASRLDR